MAVATFGPAKITFFFYTPGAILVLSALKFLAPGQRISYISCSGPFWFKFFSSPPAVKTTFTNLGHSGLNFFAPAASKIDIYDSGTFWFKLFFPPGDKFSAIHDSGPFRFKDKTTPRKPETGECTDGTQSLHLARRGKHVFEVK